ncbi:hypothetical protein [Methylocystis bryophila]|uniref:Uncharacterized protein n=1 Tax=Methylocystis bryophila TaxID=655015 RepID=A0A1W6MQS7_9HYPH|nr:hypothetical protein [Methylocystis bryophila]ARN79960.1 hypothetical protein B1812_01455 [Methylocystis bryophila]BDV39862.1 hypothetical protein DSM21852_31150 [Methylocystis bryophila]
MTRKSRLRTLTSLVIIGACVYAISGAVTLLRYSSTNNVANDAAGVSALASYANVFPVGHLARQRLAQWASQGGSPAQMIEPFSSLLSLTPADGAAWLALAQAEASAGMPADQVVRALAMSSVTAPSESRVMTGRAVFTLQIWNSAPAEARSVFVSDLLWDFANFSKEQIAYIRAAVANLPADARKRIAADFRAAGRRGDRPLRELNLPASEATP